MNTPSKGARIGSAEPGFTLIETIVVILVLGVITAISVTHMHGSSDDARTASARHRAKIILSIYSAAVEAGANESTDGFNGLNSKDKIIDALMDGVVGTGQYADRAFQLSPFDPASQEEAEEFLDYDPVQGELVYNPGGALP